MNHLFPFIRYANYKTTLGFFLSIQNLHEVIKNVYGRLFTQHIFKIPDKNLLKWNREITVLAVQMFTNDFFLSQH